MYPLAASFVQQRRDLSGTKGRGSGAVVKKVTEMKDGGMCLTAAKRHHHQDQEWIDTETSLVDTRLKGIIHPAAGNARASRSSRSVVDASAGPSA